MFLFTKRVTLANGTKTEIAAKEKQLQDAGIKTNSWCTDAPVVIGGPHMNTSDWAGKHYENHDEERKVYHLEVAAKDQYKAMKILMGEDAARGEDFIK